MGISTSENTPLIIVPRHAHVASSHPETVAQRPVTWTPSGPLTPLPVGSPTPQNNASGSANTSFNVGSPKSPNVIILLLTMDVLASQAVDGQPRASSAIRCTMSPALFGDPPYAAGVRRANTPLERAACRLAAAGRFCRSVCSAFAARMSITPDTETSGSAGGHKRAVRCHTSL